MLTFQRQKIGLEIDMGDFMDFSIRHITVGDKNEVIDMMRTFYSSPAVATDGSDEIFENNVDNCINSSPYLTGYVFERDKKIIGYAMLAFGFSTEYGLPCVWIEDIYIKDEYRGKGIAKKFFGFVEENYKGSLLKLEVEKENKRAIALYESCGFDYLPYHEMKKKI